MNNLCDQCGAAAVNAKRTRPLVEIYGPNGATFTRGTCDACGKPDVLHHYSDINPPIDGSAPVGLQSGDARARALQQAQQWNERNLIGTRVYYFKSAIEGKVELETATLAYALGGDPVVELRGIGIALLSKLELMPKTE